MTYEEIEAKQAVFDEDGFLKTMVELDRVTVQKLAYENEIGDLTEDHWRVIEFVKSYYRTYGTGPPVVKIGKATGLKNDDICTLFPCGLVKGAYRLAGLPRPPGCA